MAVSSRVLRAGVGDLQQTLTVSVSVTNRGEFAGVSAEVIMVFAVPRLSKKIGEAQSVSLPRQTLVGFTKIRIAAGATTTVDVEVPVRRLRLVGPDGQYELLQGKYELHIGGRAPGIRPEVNKPLVSVLTIQ